MGFAKRKPEPIFNKIPTQKFETKKEAIDSLMAAINSKSPKSIVTGTEYAKIPVGYIKTGIYSLDRLFGGKGLVKGKVVHIYGEGSAGKSTTLAEIIGFLHMLDPESHAVILATETFWDAKNIPYFESFGIDMDRLHIIPASNHEKALDIGLAIMASRQVDLFALDSAAAVIKDGENNKSAGDSQKTADRSVTLESFMRKLTARLHPIYDEETKSLKSTNTVVCILNQMRTGMDMNTGKSWREPASAKSMRFFTDIGIEVRAGQEIVYMKTESRLDPESELTAEQMAEQMRLVAKGEKIGKVIHYEIERNRVHHTEGRKTEAHFYNSRIHIASGTGFTGFGFDRIYNAVETAIDCGLITGSGAWWYFEDLKWQGWEKMLEDIRYNPAMQERFLRKLEMHIYGEVISYSDQIEIDLGEIDGDNVQSESVQEPEPEPVKETKPPRRKKNSKRAGDEVNSGKRRGRPPKA